MVGEFISRYELNIYQPRSCEVSLYPGGVMGANMR
jgi:hypothetical protein